MGRRWWIASGVLLGVLALTSLAVTRLAQQRADAPVDASNVFTVFVDGPDPWWSSPVRVVGAVLIGLGVLLAVAVASYGLGRRRALASVNVDDVPAGQEGSENPSAERDRRPRARTAVLALCAVLAVGGAVMVWPRGGDASYRLTNGEKGILPLDNIAAVPAPLTSAGYGVIVTPGTVPYVEGLPFAVARESLQQAGFASIVVAGPDGELAPDEVRPDVEVRSIDPAPGSSPPSGTRVVVRVR